MWLLETRIHQALSRAMIADIGFTAEQKSDYVASIGAAGSSRIMSTAGSNAEIHVNGVLTNAPDIFAHFFGGGNTTYPEIISALAEADADPSVENILMRFDSGGGSVNGMFDAIAAMQATKKPIKAIVGTMAASAAYALASQADKMVAASRSSMTGSIGIVVDTYIDPNEVSITSTNAPNKRPDLSN